MQWQPLIQNMAFLDPKTRRATKGGLAAAIFLSAAVGIIFAGEPQSQIFAGRAAAEYHRAQTQFQSNTNDPAAAWQFARACYDFNDFVMNNAGCATLADRKSTRLNSSDLVISYAV